MKRSFGTGLAVLFLVIFVCACGRGEPELQDHSAESAASSTAAGEPESGGQSAADEETGVVDMEIPQTGWTEAVPAEYTKTAAEQGNVVRLDYESEDYVRDGSTITKTAYVYTPYGYDENDTETRYNILYLMHGWGGHAGEYFDFTATKNMFDNLIAKGDIPPIIIVSATFYNENSSTDFSSSIEEFRAFHQDFEEHLMPAVEGKFHTYAESTSPEDLKASRDHRAFGGFSLGSVTTWLQFCYDYDYIHWFLPMSGSCWYYGTYGDFRFEDNVDFIEQIVNDENLDERGYFIYHAVGTQDAVKSQSIGMAKEMLSREIFTPDHYVFYQKDGGYHDFNAVQEYLYNALPLFFREKNDTSGKVCVGTNDGIANWRMMQSRINAMSAAGIPTEFHAYEGLSHGFGLGTGTVAECWINGAVAFGEQQM